MGYVIREFIFKSGHPGSAGLSGDDLEHAQEHVMQKDNLLITLLL